MRKFLTIRFALVSTLSCGLVSILLSGCGNDIGVATKGKPAQASESDLAGNASDVLAENTNLGSPHSRTPAKLVGFPELRGPIDTSSKSKKRQESSETTGGTGISNQADVHVFDDGYTDAQLHKNFTLLMLAYEPDLRAKQLMNFLREYLTPEQQDRGLKLLLKHDHEFQALKAKRVEILNDAVDGDDTALKLRKLKIEIVEVSDRLRNLVHKEILTHQQKQLRAAAVAEARKTKELEKKERQAKNQEKNQRR